MSAVVHHATWRELLDVVPSCDLLCVDAPYSEKTHRGHDDGAATADRAKARAERSLNRGLRPNEKRERSYALRASKSERSKINYGFWTPEDVRQFVEAWAPRTSGWFVSLTDSELAPYWAAALEAQGRLVFSPLACVEPGSRVRMGGDGPSQWSCWAIVARPRTRAMASWGALPGAYVITDGNGSGKRRDVVGGKPLWLMERLVEDYSRPGDLVCDPCCGAGTTLVAALKQGRRAIGGDMMAEHAALAREAVEAELSTTTVRAARAGQVPLFGGAGT